MIKKCISLLKEGTWRKVSCILCILLCSLTVVAQQQVSGKVVDADGISVAGVSVSEKGTSNGVVTDSEGNFSISVQSGEAVLHISCIGYVTQEIAVGNRTEINVTLLDDMQDLDEVVVVGYGTQKKVNLSGAVATISAKALDNRPVTNANLALQGLASGMNITMGEGRANNAPDINIRGATSINGGSAFILLDNVPVGAGELSRINPADIESVSVLKDASAAAIYGARAAFGVVLITTKSAKSQKLQVDFDANYGIRQLQEQPNLITEPYDFMTLLNESIYPEVFFSDAQIAYAKERRDNPSLPETIIHPNNPNSWDYYATTDWLGVIYRQTSPSYTANVRVAQNTDKLSYIMSGGYYQQDGILNIGNDIMRRYNFRGKGTYQLTKWWELGSNISFVTSNYDYPSVLDHGYYEKPVVCRPRYPVYNPDGTYTEMGADVYGFLEKGGRTYDRLNETQISLSTTFDLLEDVWNIKGDINFRRTNSTADKEVFRSPPYHDGPTLGFGTHGFDGSQNYGRASSNVSNYTVLNIYTDFHKTFADKHYLQALAGFNQEYSYWNNFWTKREDLITPSLPTIQLATGSVSNLQDINELALRGLFLRVNYIYDNKYILEFDGRRDGTSRYPKDSRWGFFPSASAAWVVSQEQFFSGISDALKISNLKFRGSYGALGNQAIGNNYPYLATMGSGNIGTRLDNNYPMGINQPGTVPGDLTWEKVRTVNGAVEIGLFDNKFDLGFDIYTRYTEGMLTKSKTLPALYGADSPNTNAANLKTKGWELSLGYRDRVNVGGSPLSFSARFMLWDSRAWITKFDNPDKNIGDHYEGKELGEIWGLHTLGFFSSNEEAAAWVDQSAVGSPFMNNMFYAGDLKFEDINKDDKINLGKGTVDDPGDRTIIGNNTARLLYSFEGNVEWKGFDLRVFIQGVGKRDWYPSGSYRSFWGFYNMRWINHTYEHLDRWTEDNPNGYFPRLKERIANDGELKYEQTKYMQDASYMRLKNLTVGYTLPSTLTNKWKIERMRIYFSGENIWTLSHIRMPWIDPETYNQNEYYPLQKTWSIGLNLNF